MRSIENGRNEELSANSVMSANEIAAYLIKHCRSLESFEAYLFGSTLNGMGQDIDILIIGPSGIELSALKHELMIVGKELPLDILYMQPSEAIETDFVNKEGCVELSTLASINFPGDSGSI